MKRVTLTPRWPGVLAAALALVLAGCSAQRIRDDAQAQMRAGNHEAGLARLQEGLRRHPESVLLKSGLLAGRDEAVGRWLTEAGQLRATGRFDDAEALLHRILGVDPANDRVPVLLQELAAERRVAGLLHQASSLLAEQRREPALQLVDRALSEMPRHPAATVLRRQIEAEQRMAAGNARLQLAATRLITVDFRGAPLVTVLEAITRGSGINFILDRDVKQDSKVTIYLRSATVADAIDLIGGAHQLARRIIDPGTVLLYPNTPDKQREHQEQIVRVFHLANADAKGTAQLLRSMLRLKDPFVDERGNMVAIRESPDLVAMAERLVALHDAGDAEVMLEVEILEVKTSRLKQLGITVPNGLTLTPLGMLASNGGGTSTPGTGASTLTLRGLRDINSERIGVSVGGVVLNLRREVGDFNILANPRIRAKNREKARIVIGDRFPVVTSTATATGFVSESISYLDVGLKLDVEPAVSLDDDVTIKLALEVSAIAGSLRTAGGSIAYQVGTRNATTTLRLRDGETQVLAGLISNDDRTTANRIPGLGDLPIAGRLFSSQLDEFQRTELMLAITPRVLRSAFRPDPSQAELWVGTENLPRLRLARPSTDASATPQAAARPAAVMATAAAVVAVTPGVVAESGTSPPIAVAPEGSGPERAAASSRPLPATAAIQAHASPRITAPAPPRAGEAGPMAAPRLSWKGPPVFSAGETHRVLLHLVSPFQLRGALVDLVFSPQHLEILEVVEGSFFKEGGGTTHFTHALDGAKGHLSVGVLRSDLSGAAGDAPFIELRLRVREAGDSELAVRSLRPIGLGGPAAAGELSALRIVGR